MSEVSGYEGVSYDDVESIKAILNAFYGRSVADRVTATSVSDETLRLIALLLEETGECSHWIDMVPSPKDLISPMSSFKKYALRLIRNAGKAFMDTSFKVNVMCKRVAAVNYKTPILMSLM